MVTFRKHVYLNTRPNKKASITGLIYRNINIHLLVTQGVNAHYISTAEAQEETLVY